MRPFFSKLVRPNSNCPSTQTRNGFILRLMGAGREGRTLFQNKIQSPRKQGKGREKGIGNDEKGDRCLSEVAGPFDSHSHFPLRGWGFVCFCYSPGLCMRQKYHYPHCLWPQKEMDGEGMEKGEREREASSFTASTGREETQWEEERSTLSLKTCLLDVV